MTPPRSVATVRAFARRLIVLAALALATPAAFAQAPSDADVNRLLAASRAQTMLDTMLPQIEAMQQQQFAQLTAQRQLDAAQQAQLQRIQERTRQTVRKALSWSELRPMYVDIYKRSFSREDVLAMAEFYESLGRPEPAGQDPGTDPEPDGRDPAEDAAAVCRSAEGSGEDRQ